MPPWHRISVSGYSDIQWTYKTRAPRLVCNGIVVVKGAYWEDQLDSVADGISLRKPTVSVFDPDGVLPLNLPRTNLAKDLPFKIQLRPAHDGPELAHIAGPIVGEHNVEGRPREPIHRLGKFGVRQIQESLGQVREVLFALSQRRDPNREFIQTEVEVAAE